MFGSKPFEQSPTSPFGLQQSFGSSPYETPGTSPLSCSSSPAFGFTGQIFGNTSGGAFGQSSSPLETTVLSFGSPTTPSGFTVTVTFGDPSAPSFGAAISSPSGAQITFTRSHASTPSSGGQSVFGGQQGGSRVSPYSSTPYIDGSFTWKLLSLSAMPVYEGKSHEEFRWKDYQLGDKGSPSLASQLITAVSFGQSPTTSSNLFSSSNPLSPEVTRDSPFGSSSTSAYCLSHFGTSNTSNNFSPTSFPPSLFGSKSQTSAFGSPKFHFGMSEQGTTSASGARFNFGNTRSSFIFQSSAEPAFTSTSSPCGQTTSSTFCQTCSVFGQSNLSSTTPSSTFGGSMISNSSFLPSNSNHIVFGQTAPSRATPFQPLQPAHSCGGFRFKNTGQSQEAPTSGFGGASGLCGQIASGEDVKTLEGHRAGKATILHKHEADIEALMPKLRHSDYYTEPGIQEIAAKERAEQGYCRHVKDFVVGRHGYGSIKFGETDVRRLDLESIVQFNNREVIVYADDSEEVPVGQGLNKPAEVTLLNVKCVDKASGKQCTEGAKLERFKEMLRKKAEGQGAEFVSYDPVKGEWKFRVQHFSRYELGEEDDCSSQANLLG